MILELMNSLFLRKQYYPLVPKMAEDTVSEGTIDKLMKVSTPLASIIIVLYLVFNFVISINKPASHSETQRTSYDERILVIMETQASAIAKISENQQEIASILSEQRKMLLNIQQTIDDTYAMHKRQQKSGVK